MRIQALVFISGYLLGYTSKRKAEALSFKNCVVKKIKRLLIPSIVFSTIYIMIFFDITSPINKISYSIINGAGHMWFLPMLFWCFVGVYVVEKLRIKPLNVLIVGLLLSVIQFPILPLRINITLRYFIFFWMGFGIQRNYFGFLFQKDRLKPILISVSIYIAAFIVNYVLFEDQLKTIALNESRLLNKVIYAFAYKALCLAMSISGLLAAFWSAHYFIIGKYKLPNWIIKLSTFCYGIYICQQFILLILYYHTDLPVLCGSMALPWVAMAITLFLSVLMTSLLLHTRFGRFLIG